MINKQRVQRIRGIIYLVIFLIFFVPLVLVIILNAKLLFALRDLNENLGAAQAAAGISREDLFEESSMEENLPAEDSSPERTPADASSADEPSVAQQALDPDVSTESGDSPAMEEPSFTGIPDPEIPQDNGSDVTGQGDNPLSGRELVKNTYSPASYPDLYFDTLPVDRPHKPGVLFLTFDNTPSAQADEILAVLDKHGVKATFFVWWNETLASGNLQFYKRIVEDGHSIGIHSASSEESFISLYTDADHFIGRFHDIFERIYAGTGVRTRLYRLPGGSVMPGNTQRQTVLSAIKSDLDARGFRQFDWNASAQDAVSPVLDKEQILENMKRSIAPDGQVVILLHDGTGASTTAEALDDFIAGQLAGGYRFEAIQYDTPTVSFLDQ